MFVDTVSGSPRQEMDAVPIDKATSLLGDERVLKNLFEGYNEPQVLRGQTASPRLTEPQLCQPVPVILSDYWNLS